MGRDAPLYPDEQREAVVRAVLDEGRTVREALQKAEAGELGIDRFSVSLRTAQRWVTYGRRERVVAGWNDDLEGLLDACDALGEYGPKMRALIVVAAYTGMWPGELFELRWSGVRFEDNRIVVSRRLYRGLVDTPKNGGAKTIALPPPVKDA